MMLDTFIIGAGPAGITAAVYAKRYNLTFEILEKESIVGGKVNYPHWIENFIGYPDGIKGSSLAEVFDQHLHVLDIQPIHGLCEKITEIQNGYEVTTSKGDTYQSKTIVIATGTVDKKLGIPGEEAFIGKGVSTCATCDAPFFKNKTIAVVGGGDSALAETNYLSEFASKIYLIHRREEFRGVPSLVKALEENPSIQLYKGYLPVSIQGDQFVQSITIQNKQTNRQETLDVNGVFVFSGYIPKTDFILFPLVLDDQGFIKTDAEMKTSQSRVYAVGDIQSKALRQIVTATSDGAIAIHSIRNLLHA
ncbi:MAG: FAD-dependent oxidoreductase [Caldisericia bacterium]|nr:FAD-dependent oxidoreductase [Caldisericia bacterium]